MVCDENPGGETIDCLRKNPQSPLIPSYVCTPAASDAYNLQGYTHLCGNATPNYPQMVCQIGTQSRCQRAPTPTAPVLNGVANTPDQGFILCWDAELQWGGQTYELYRTDIPERPIYSITPKTSGSQTYTDENATLCRPYGYYLKVIGQTGSASSQTIMISNPTCGSTPKLTIDPPTLSNGNVLLKWSSDGSSNYDVYRSMNHGPSTKIASTNLTSLSDPDVSKAQLYTYRVVSQKADSSANYTVPYPVLTAPLPVSDRSWVYTQVGIFLLILIIIVVIMIIITLKSEDENSDVILRSTEG